MSSCCCCCGLAYLLPVRLPTAIYLLYYLAITCKAIILETQDKFGPKVRVATNLCRLVRLFWRQLLPTLVDAAHTDKAHLFVREKERDNG